MTNKNLIVELRGCPNVDNYDQYSDYCDMINEYYDFLELELINSDQS